MTDRERLLWALTTALVVVILSTLGVAPDIAGALRDAGLLDVAFGLGAILVLLAVIVIGLADRPRGALVGIVVGTMAVVWLSVVRTSLPADRTHLIEYGVVALLVDAAFRERAASRGTPRRPGATAVVVTAGVGLADELVQWVLPSRVFDPIDVAFNAVAAVLVIGGTTTLRRLRPRRR